MDGRGLLAAVQEYIQDQLAGFLPHQPGGAIRAEITLHMPDGEVNKLSGYIRLPVLLPGTQRQIESVPESPPARVQQSAQRVTVEQHEEEEDPAPQPEPVKSPPKFTPNDFQADIMSALEFRAFRSDALVNELGCDRRRLWKPGGIKELVAEGWVKLDTDKRLGYYRPDAPPDELKKRTYSDEPEDES